MTKRTKFRVFYSWQSDLPGKTNRNAIRDSLKAAKKTLEAKHEDIELILDEATRDVSGSPNIAKVIIDKIDQADAIVADVTTVTPAGAARPCPNPNVTFELGYAVCEVGWNRIILPFNEAFGLFPKDMPFDFAQHRAMPYTLREVDTKGLRSGFDKGMAGALDLIISTRPKRPAELRGLQPAKVQHEHDVKNLRWMMSQLNLPRMDDYILELPRRIDDEQFWFYESFRGVVQNSLFTLYDQPLLEQVESLSEAWRMALSFDQFYRDTPSGRSHIFANPGDMPLRPDQQAAWDVIEGARLDMRKALDAILVRLRKDYLEVDLRKTNDVTP